MCFLEFFIFYFLSFVMSSFANMGAVTSDDCSLFSSFQSYVTGEWCSASTVGSFWTVIHLGWISVQNDYSTSQRCSWHGKVCCVAVRQSYATKLATVIPIMIAMPKMAIRLVHSGTRSISTLTVQSITGLWALIRSTLELLRSGTSG